MILNGMCAIFQYQLDFYSYIIDIGTYHKKLIGIIKY